MKQKAITYADLIKMAESYGVDKNALFISAANQYIIQRDVIDKIKSALDDGDPVVTKEYVKGRENLMANPLILQLPKHIDSANKTLSTMLDIVQKLGHETDTGANRFGDLID